MLFYLLLHGTVRLFSLKVYANSQADCSFLISFGRMGNDKEAEIHAYPYYRFFQYVKAD